LILVRKDTISLVETEPTELQNSVKKYLIFSALRQR